MDFGVNGWIKNLADGRVEGVFEGEESAVQDLVKFVSVGPKHAEVENVEEVKEDYIGEFHTFSIY
jgi:acylphosphatase